MSLLIDLHHLQTSIINQSLIPIILSLIIAVLNRILMTLNLILVALNRMLVVLSRILVIKSIKKHKIFKNRLIPCLYRIMMRFLTLHINLLSQKNSMLVILRKILVKMMLELLRPAKNYHQIKINLLIDRIMLKKLKKMKNLWTTLQFPSTT